MTGNVTHTSLQLLELYFMFGLGQGWGERLKIISENQGRCWVRAEPSQRAWIARLHGL